MCKIMASQAQAFASPGPASLTPQKSAACPYRNIHLLGIASKGKEIIIQQAKEVIWRSCFRSPTYQPDTRSSRRLQPSLCMIFIKCMSDSAVHSFWHSNQCIPRQGLDVETGRGSHKGDAESLEKKATWTIPICIQNNKRRVVAKTEMRIRSECSPPYSFVIMFQLLSLGPRPRGNQLNSQAPPGQTRPNYAILRLKPQFSCKITSGVSVPNQRRWEGVPSKSLSSPYL